MNGHDLARAAGAQIFGFLLIAFAAGGVLVLGGYLLITWLVTHVSIGIS